MQIRPTAAQTPISTQTLRQVLRRRTRSAFIQLLFALIQTGCKLTHDAHKNLFHTYSERRIKIETAAGQQIYSAGIGTIVFKPSSSSEIIKPAPITFHEVLYVPDLTTSLFSLLAARVRRCRRIHSKTATLFLCLSHLTAALYCFSRRIASIFGWKNVAARFARRDNFLYRRKDVKGHASSAVVSSEFKPPPHLY